MCMSMDWLVWLMSQNIYIQRILMTSLEIFINQICIMHGKRPEAITGPDQICEEDVKSQCQ